MRSDFNKVLVDCYRVGGGSLRRGRLPRDPDDLPGRQGMRRPYRIGHWGTAKDFGENLSPLFRFLDKQAGRPWAKVYSELCSTFDMRKTINQHILLHVNEYVQQHALLVDGRIVIRSRFGEGLREVSGLYVHPTTGLLRRAKSRGPTAREREARREQEALRTRRQVDKDTWLIRYEDVWYVVALAKFPARVEKNREVRQADGSVRQVRESYVPKVRDVLFKRSNGFEPFTRDGRSLQDLCFQFYGSRNHYAISKRQVSRQELKQYGVL